MMFRTMSRSKQQLSDTECIDILKQEPRGVLSVLGDDDYPYGLPIDFWYCEENGRIYFHSGKAGHKIDAMRKHDKVSFCVYDQGHCKESDWALTIRSVIVFGRVRILEDQDRAIEVTRRLSYKFTPDTKYIENEIAQYSSGLLCFELIPEHITGKVVREA